MNIKFLTAIVGVAICSCVSTASAQLLGGSGSAGTLIDTSQIQEQVRAQVQTQVQAQIQAQAQAEVQNQIQTQIQNQVQAQVQNQIQLQIQNQVQAEVQGQVQAQVQNQIQAQVQNQVQSRIQSESTRAAGLALQLSGVASQRLDAGLNANLSTAANLSSPGVTASLPGVRLGNNLRPGSTDDRRSVSAGLRNVGSTRAEAASSINISAADVQIYDSIFGQFNPLVETVKVDVANNVKGSVQSNVASRINGAVKADSVVGAQANADQNVATAQTVATRTLIDLSAQTDFASRIALSARQRQAEISQVRDQAISTGNAELLTQADLMESRLQAFAEAHGMIESRIETQSQIEAQAQARVQARAMATAQGQLESNVQSARSAARTTADSQLNAAAEMQTTAAAQAQARANQAMANRVQAAGSVQGSGSVNGTTPATSNRVNGEAASTAKASSGPETTRR